ncbi:MAG: hypothetical protein Q7S85_00500 [Rugosibacter sp.]|nr:hypothetical protein [Rugosibacter sp.]
MKRGFAFVLCGVLASAACAGVFEPKIPREAAVAAAGESTAVPADVADTPAPVAPVAPLVPAPPAEPLTVLTGRQGYAVERPEILVRQRVFGRAHGVSLLAAACLDLPAQSAAVQDAYAAWHAKQATAIETVVHELSRYYFGERADEAQWPDLARALNLKDDIAPSLGQFTLEVACASLTQVLDKPRYDLVKLLADPAAFDAPDLPASAPAPPVPANPAAAQSATPVAAPATAAAPVEPAPAAVAPPRSGHPGMQSTPAPTFETVPIPHE